MVPLLLALPSPAAAQAPADSLTSEADSLTPNAYRLTPNTILTSRIRLLTRSYGDRVVLRWMPEDYVSWRFLRYYGVNVLRVKPGTMDIDTLAYALKPLTRDELTARYPTTDELAMSAAGIMYGGGRLNAYQTHDGPGTMGAGVELNSEQDISFGYAMLIAEWRPDLAEAMAVGLTDRTARKGETYDYYVQVTQWELDGKIIFEPGVDEGVEVTAYKPSAYEPQLMDTLTSPRRVALSWIDTEHSSFEIERRELPLHGKKGDWQRLNDKPYVSMVSDGSIDGLCLYSDSVSHEGTWEYHVMAHDAFGELTPPATHTVYVRDIEAPKAPEITRIVIDRQDDRTLAHVSWRVRQPQESDLQGYIVHYYNDNFTGSHWLPMNGQMVAPADTMTTIDVTGLRSGMICVMAYDDSGNEGQSLAQFIRISDRRAPAPPDTISHTVLPQGYVVLTWQPRPEDDDIMHYDVAFANDSTHEFLVRNEGGLTDPMFVDTLAMDVNQKYIYYKVRATDYSGNVGLWSAALRVRRPHNTPPTAAHIGASTHDEGGMHMRWVVGTDADMDYHLLLRRLGTEGPWQTVARWDADSIAATEQYAVSIDDNPPYHQSLRYYYMVESHNASPYTAHSLAVSWMHQGPRYLDIPIRLVGDYVRQEKLVKLVWDIGEMPVKDADYYICVFRKRQGEQRFRYMYNVKPEEQEFTDGSLAAGEEASYYVSIRFRDGRESRESNVVTVQLPPA